MDLILIFTTSLLVLTASLLITIVLFQHSQDEGAYGTLSSSRMQHMIGSAHAPDILEKITRVLATIFILLILLNTYVIQRGYGTSKKSGSDTLEDVRSFIIEEELEGNDQKK